MKNENKFTYRITYTKDAEVKYISHLDFLRCLTRSLKRAKLPVRYSQGFNPHIVQNIALPCPVGVESECEMADVDLVEFISADEVAKRLSDAFPRGVRVISCKEKTDADPEFSLIGFARYKICFTSDKDFDPTEFDNSKEFMIEKKSKRGMKEVNIKDFIAQMHTLSLGENKYEIDAILCAGGLKNLKTDLLVQAIESFYGANLTDVRSKRMEIIYQNVSFAK